MSESFENEFYFKAQSFEKEVKNFKITDFAMRIDQS